MTTKTIRRTGLEVKLVNDLPVETLQDFLNAIDQYKSNKLQFNVEHELLGSGACGRVYEFNEDYALKINGTGWYAELEETCDGAILESLQGVPLIPTLYAYTTNNEFTLVQRIKGVTWDKYLGGTPFTPLNFKEDEWLKASELFYEYSQERGWTPKDLHSENLMIDEEGKIWVIDVGLFVPQGNYCYVPENREIDEFVVLVSALKENRPPNYFKVSPRKTRSKSREKFSLSYRSRLTF